VQYGSKSNCIALQGGKFLSVLLFSMESLYVKLKIFSRTHFKLIFLHVFRQYLEQQFENVEDITPKKVYLCDIILKLEIRAGPFDCDNEPPDSLKGWEFLD
jgi:hypothetical protein